jgi:hypothetical protein
MHIQLFGSLLSTAAIGLGRPRSLHLSEEMSNGLGLSAEIQVDLAF